MIKVVTITDFCEKSNIVATTTLRFKEGIFETGSFEDTKKSVEFAIIPRVGDHETYLVEWKNSFGEREGYLKK